MSSTQACTLFTHPSTHAQRDGQSRNTSIDPSPRVSPLLPHVELFRRACACHRRLSLCEETTMRKPHYVCTSFFEMQSKQTPPSTNIRQVPPTRVPGILAGLRRNPAKKENKLVTTPARVCATWVLGSTWKQKKKTKAAHPRQENVKQREKPPS